MAIEYYSSISLNGNSIDNFVVQKLGSAPGSPYEGQLYYDTGDDTVYLRTGSAWVDLAGGDVSGTTFATDLKIGRDSQNLIDFATTDNKIIFRVNNVNEVEMVANVLQPTTNDGMALGTGSLMWSDLFLASGSVINFNNGDVTATHSSNTLTIGGGTLATAALTTSTIVASGIIKTDDTTAATTTTDGSLQTDGGLSVALDAVIGDDLILISDAAVLSLGVGADVTLTHDNGTGGTLASAGNFVVDSTAGTLILDGHAGATIQSAADITIASAHAAGVALHVDVDANAGSILDIDAGIIDIDVADAITIDAADEIVITTGSADGHISLVSAHTAGQAVHIDANANVGSILDIDAGILDIDVDDAITIDAADEIVITTGSADGHISLVTAHTAGVAVHIDANANAGSIVDIDAGILDVDVTGASTIDTTLLTLTSAGGITVLDTTASAADQGGTLILANDDGAAMADNHRLGVIEFKGAEDASNTLTTGARIEAICDAGWSASENGASLQFFTTDANASQSLSLTIDSNKKGTFAGDVHVAGALTVAGTTTTQNTVVVENTVTTLVFEGATADAHETTLKVVEPTADCTFSLPTLTAGNYFIPAIAGTATDASAAVTAAEFALLDGGSTVGTTAIGNGDGIVTNDGGTMKQTTVQTFQTYFDANSVGGANVVTTGALGAGSIAAGFGAIDNGTSGIRTNIFTAETSFLPDADDGATLGSANLNFSDVFLADGAVLNFGDDQDVKLTHVADAGILLNDAMKIQFNDASQFIHASSATVLELGATDEIGLTATAIDITGTCDVSGAFSIGGTAIVAQATASAVGGVELATAAEVLTGTDTARVVTADTLSAKTVVGIIDVSSLTDVLTVTIPHSLGTADVMVQMYDTVTEATIFADVGRTTDNMSTASTANVSIDFASAPPNDIRVIITSLAGASASGTVAYT